MLSITLILNRASFFLLLLSIIAALTLNKKGFQKKVEPNWPESRLLLQYPDSSTIMMTGADVFEGSINTVHQHFDTTGGTLHYSEIFLNKKRPGEEVETCQLSDSSYPAEQPTMIRSHSGKLNIFWGERRVDTRFEQWNMQRPIGMSTSLFHTELHGCDSFEPDEIYKGSLSVLEKGAGELRLPVSAATVTEEKVSITFGADGVYSDLWNNYTTGVAFISGNKSTGWKETQYVLAVRFQQEISGSATNHLVLSHIGAPPLLPEGNSNEIYVIHSADGGESWSEPVGVFTESGHAHDGGVLSYLKTDMHSNGQVHLIWGQHRNSGFSVFPNLLWHSFSNDYGNTWSEPEMFFDVLRPDVDHYHVIRSTSMVVDRAGRVHWAGVTHLGGINGIEQSELHYKIWDPQSRSWDHSEVIATEGNPGSVNLSIDAPENNLYLFWETEGNESFGLSEATYYTFRDLGDESRLPVISKAGPLEVHKNYPNPFNTTTTIPFTLKETGNVVLHVYDIGGRRLFKKDLGVLPEGFYRERLELDRFSSGMYIYELIVNGKYRQEEKMIVVK